MHGIGVSSGSGRDDGFRVTGSELQDSSPGSPRPAAIVVPKEGLEPSLPCGNWILNPARLPIPPLRLVGRRFYGVGGFGESGNAGGVDQEPLGAIWTSILAARMKSFWDNPPIAWVVRTTRKCR